MGVGGVENRKEGMHAGGFEARGSCALFAICVKKKDELGGEEENGRTDVRCG